MSQQVKVPPVGESINEVVVAQWLKADGDYVEMDEVICELESDKASFELNAESAGTLKVLVAEGEEVEIGTVICEIDSDGQPSEGKEESSESQKSSESQQTVTDEAQGAKPEPAPAKKSAGKKETSEEIEMRVPEVGESITEVTVSAWLKNDGDHVTLDETIADIESDKASFDLPAEATGILEIVAQEGDTLEIGALICKIQVTDEAPDADKPVSKPKQEVAQDNEKSGSHAQGHPSPAAAKILKEKGLKPGDIEGTGVAGRITKEDALQAGDKSESAEKAEEKPSTSSERPQRREKMSSLRRTIARRLVAAKNETAMLTTFNEVDMHPIMEIRRKYKEQFKEKKEVGLGFMSFFTKAVCMALEEWPAVNAMIDEQEIVYNDYCDISIAVSSPKGLVVPVIRNAEKMNFEQIEKEVVRLAKKARDGKLSIEEMTGGTFTITNGGIFGSMLSTPIINQPQSAILGMHNIVERPTAINGEVAIRPIMYVALSYDHRIVDGRESVSFLYRVKELLEDPTRMLVGI